MCLQLPTQNCLQHVARWNCEFYKQFFLFWTMIHLITYWYYKMHQLKSAVTLFFTLRNSLQEGQKIVYALDTTGVESKIFFIINSLKYRGFLFDSFSVNSFLSHTDTHSSALKRLFLVHSELILKCHIINEIIFVFSNTWIATYLFVSKSKVYSFAWCAAKQTI